jgi:hypothetical protein
MNDQVHGNRRMFGIFPEPSFMPCEDCGASLARMERDQHTCVPDRRLEYELFQLRRELAGFDEQLSAYLASARGRFDVFYAERSRPPLQET